MPDACVYVRRVVQVHGPSGSVHYCVTSGHVAVVVVGNVCQLAFWTPSSVWAAAIPKMHFSGWTNPSQGRKEEV